MAKLRAADMATAEHALSELLRRSKPREGKTAKLEPENAAWCLWALAELQLPETFRISRVLDRVTERVGELNLFECSLLASSTCRLGLGEHKVAQRIALRLCDLAARVEHPRGSTPPRIQLSRSGDADVVVKPKPLSFERRLGVQVVRLDGCFPLEEPLPPS